MRRSVSCSSTICSGSDVSADSGLSSRTPDSVITARCGRSSAWQFVPSANLFEPGHVVSAQPSSSHTVASLKQAVVPGDSFEAYQRLITSRQGGQCNSPHGLSTPSRLLQDIQAQNQAAIAQVKQTLHSHTRFWPIQRPKQASPSQHWNWLEESNADVAVDVECCGDSGAASKICSLVQGVSTSSRNAAPPPSIPEHSTVANPSSLFPACAPVRVMRNALDRSRDSIACDDMPMALTPRMPHAGSALSEPQASSELLFRLNHARQTVSFVQRQLGHVLLEGLKVPQGIQTSLEKLFAMAQVASARRLSRGSYSVWEALEKLSTVKEPCCPDPEAPNLTEQALLTAEACRHAHPQQEWLHLVALIHELGKLLAHTSFGPQPDWAIFPESFPVGCAFHCNITYSQFFSVNPDRRRRLYNTPSGMYKPGCGLSAVQMSWTAYEYLHHVLLLNKTFLPPVAQFLIRHCHFLSLTMPGQAYDDLLDDADVAMLPWLYRFLSLKQSVQQPHRRPAASVQLDSIKPYYDMLIAKYIPGSKLRF